MTTVLVTGATGTVGSLVMGELSRRGATARAFVRDADRASTILGEDADLAVGDFGDAASMRRALAGVDHVFLACANTPGQVGFEVGAIDAAAGAGVRRIVKLSALGAQAGSPLTFWDWQGRIEAHLASSGVPAVVLRPGSFMTNLLAAAEAMVQTGCLFAPASGARVAMIDPRDVAEVAAAALIEPGHEGSSYELTGPQSLDYEEIARTLAGVAGRPIEWVDVPDDAARLGLLAAGMPELVAEFLVGWFGAARAGAHADTTDAVRRVTGHEPRGLADFARDHVEAWHTSPVRTFSAAGSSRPSRTSRQPA